MPASSLRRVVAFALDAGALLVLHAAAFQNRWLFTAVFFVIYQTVSIAAWGCTLGKALMGLSVRRPDGTNLPWHAALLRGTVGYLASAFFLLGFLHAFRNARRRTWHDELFGSEVVQKRGALSLTGLVRAIDEWVTQVDAWQEKTFKPLARLKGLWELILKLTGILTLLESLFERIRRAFGGPAAAQGTAPAASAAIPAEIALSAAHGVTSTLTAVTFSVLTVVGYEAAAPPALRPWDAALPASDHVVTPVDDVGPPRESEPPRGLASRTDVTELINCDCERIDAGLLTGPYRVQCETAQQDLIAKYNATGRVEGTCDPVASGPNAKPQ